LLDVSDVPATGPLWYIELRVQCTKRLR